MAEDLMIAALLRLPYQAVMRRVLAEAAERGHADLRLAHFPVLQPLFFAPDGATATALAETAGVSKQAMGKTIDDLEEMGYVERVPDPDDRRARIIRLTARGRDATEVVRATARGIEEECARALGAGRFADLRRTLGDLAAALGA